MLEVSRVWEIFCSPGSACIFGILHSRGSYTFFIANFPNYFQFSATLECYKLQCLYGNRTILIDFANSKIIFDYLTWLPVWEPLQRYLSKVVFLTYPNCQICVSYVTLDFNGLPVVFFTYPNCQICVSYVTLDFNGLPVFMVLLVLLVFLIVVK